MQKQNSLPGSKGFVKVQKLLFYVPLNSKGHIGQALSIATCGRRIDRVDSLWLDAKLPNQPGHCGLLQALAGY